MSGFPRECLTGAGDVIILSSSVFLECVRKGEERERVRETETERLTERGHAKFLM